MGRAVVPLLIQRGHVVRLLARGAEKEALRYLHGVEAVPADVADAEQLAGVPEGCDAVVHLAGIVDEQPPATTFARVNHAGTRNLLAAAEQAGAPRFVFLSSLGADRGETDYHRSKLAAEESVRAYAGPWVILRPGNVYGPGDDTVSRLFQLARTLPAVPLVGDGRQPFQPLWHRDLAEVIAQTVEREDLRGRTLELAGPEVTNTEDLLRRFAAITGQKPASMKLSPAVAGWTTGALEWFGAAGRRWLAGHGLPTPITATKLRLLLEANVLPAEAANALEEEFSLTPTSLQEGLAQLMRELPPQLAGDGVGAVHHAEYWAEIDGSRVTAPELLRWVGRHLADVMPVAVDLLPEVDATEPGRLLTLRLPGGRRAPVRVVERTAGAVTFIALEGHPLAGFVRLTSEAEGTSVRFAVHVVAQPANVVEQMAFRPFGRFLQEAGWRNLVRHVVTLSGGRSVRSVRRRLYPRGDDKTAALRAEIEQLVRAAEVAASTAGAS